jgi:DNA-binding transcriptional LysR family regulator
MNLRHLEHWLALADTGSFSRAAEKLHITQSALSRSIQALEEDLGGPLVDRVGKKNELTPLGRSVLERARRIVHEAQELKQGAALLQQGGLGALRVGLGSGPWLVYMARHHPTVQVTVSRGSTELQLTQLRERQLDALVVDVRRVEAAPDLVMTQVVEMRAGFVCRQGHPLLARTAKGLPFDALLSYPMASIQLSQEVARLLVDHYGPQANPAQMTTLQCEDIASLLDVVGQTDAIYLGIVGAARAGLAQGRLVELPMQIPLKGQARLALITLAGRTELPVMSVFRAFVQNHLSD